MNNNQERKKGKRNTSSSPYDIDINSDLILNQNNTKTPKSNRKIKYKYFK